MSDLIERQAAIDSIEKHLRFGDELYPLTDTDKVLNHGFEIAASCVYNLPSAQPDLPEWAHKVEEYRKSAPSFVRNQLVWALYQTWKEYDGRLVHQRGKENR